jgi:CheY-like chemotaxis protein
MIDVSESGLAAPLVLIADDDRDTQALLALVVSRMGGTALCVSNGVAALEVVEAYGDAVAVAVLDHHMPMMTGLDVALQLHTDAPDLPLIFMSAALPAHEQARSTGMPALAILDKPFRLPLLLSTLQASLDAYSLRAHAIGDAK